MEVVMEEETEKGKNQMRNLNEKLEDAMKKETKKGTRL
jgi:hypothetical protein